jgi:hypothetical protein
MKDKRILYVSSEVVPYLAENEVLDVLRRTEDD